MLNVVLTDGMSDCLPNVQIFVQAQSALQLALVLSCHVEEFIKEEHGEATRRHVPYTAFTQCERVGSASNFHWRLAESTRTDRVLDVIGLTDEEANLWEAEG